MSCFRFSPILTRIVLVTMNLEIFIEYTAEDSDWPSPESITANSSAGRGQGPKCPQNPWMTIDRLTLVRSLPLWAHDWTGWARLTWCFIVLLSILLFLNDLLFPLLWCSLSLREGGGVKNVLFMAEYSIVPTVHCNDKLLWLKLRVASVYG